MKLRQSFDYLVIAGLALLLLPQAGMSQDSSGVPSSSSSKSAKQIRKSSAPVESGIDTGAVNDGVYRNRTLGLSCRIPAGWVLRTQEMNAREKEEDSGNASASGGHVLLAAFSRPPEARAEDVNASILIATENAQAYPGLKEAAQYFGPLTEVAKAQGFVVDEEPYEIALGTKALVRGDFHKDVGSRVMRQSTLAMLAKGYAVSITVIGGTDEEVEALIGNLGFGAQPAKQ